MGPGLLSSLIRCDPRRIALNAYLSVDLLSFLIRVRSKELLDAGAISHRSSAALKAATLE